MIKIEQIVMKEVRGIRELELDLGGRSFVISGPNGSGKSGVVDAIEFCLTGDISRLAGKGTSGITVQRHGPHVERRDDPESAEVTVKAQLVDLGRTVVLSRNMKKPKELRIDPDEPEIRAAVEEVASHPEVVLSRREIIKYIVAEAGERSREVQALLRLDRIGDVRNVLKTTNNRLKKEANTAEGEAETARTALERHLDVEAASTENILGIVNERRRILGLQLIDELTDYTVLDAGVEATGPESGFNKESALRDLAALQEALAGAPERARNHLEQLLEDLAVIEADEELLTLVQQASFLDRGLALVDSEFCPLCDSEFPDVNTLRARIEGKLARSAAATEIRTRLLSNAQELSRSLSALRTLIAAPRPLAAAEAGFTGLDATLGSWSDELKDLEGNIGTVEGVLRQSARLRANWLAVPAGIAEPLAELASTITGKPDQSAATAAQTFLVRAQDRYAEYRRARQRATQAAEAVSAAARAYQTYCSVSEATLERLYAGVEESFSGFYREVNSGDESGFKAKFEQGEGKLDLAVDFYGEGMFPPSAYHSEGHQDGMGVCLYLALMQGLHNDRFTFVVLDDVVMSIDSGHRKHFCRLLREEFPDTQFVITTHDPIWARQMRSEGLVSSRSSIEFHGWSLETGPIFEPVSEVWDRIDADLARNDVPAAAARLRRHLEFTLRELADELGARVQYHGDGTYDVGELFGAVVERHRDLLKKAKDAANSWNDEDGRARADVLDTSRLEALRQYGGEQWVVNKAIHYNEWAGFSKADVVPVVSAVRALFNQLCCSKNDCGSWLYPTPKGDPESLRCRCGDYNLNLKKK